MGYATTPAPPQNYQHTTGRSAALGTESRKGQNSVHLLAADSCCDGCRRTGRVMFYGSYRYVSSLPFVFPISLSLRAIFLSLSLSISAGKVSEWLDGGSSQLWVRARRDFWNAGSSPCVSLFLQALKLGLLRLSIDPGTRDDTPHLEATDRARGPLGISSAP